MQVLMVGGAVCKKSETGGMWTKQEQALHINALELLGAKLGLFSFFKDKKDIKHIRVMMDNNTAVAYINNMGELGLICVMYCFQHMAVGS